MIRNRDFIANRGNLEFKNWEMEDSKSRKIVRIANRFPDTGNVERPSAAAVGGHVLARLRPVVGVSARHLADSRGSEDVPSRQHGPEEPEGAADTSPDERVHGLGKGRAQKIGRRES